MIQENRDPAICAGTTEIQGHEMADGDHHSVAPGEAVRLDEFNFAEIVKGLPAKARMFSPHQQRDTPCPEANLALKPAQVHSRSRALKRQSISDR